MAPQAHAFPRSTGRRLGVCIFVLLLALVALKCTPAAAASDPEPCAIQPPPATQLTPAGQLYPEAQEVQAAVPGGIATQLEQALGSQYGWIWYENLPPHARLDVGLTAGSMTAAAATEAVDAALASRAGSSELSFLEAHTEVLPVPYSPGELQSAANSIYAQLAGVLPAGSFEVGLTVGADGGADSPGYWPQVAITLARRVDQLECEAALRILQPFAGEASLLHGEGELEIFPASALSGELRAGSPSPPPASSVTGKIPGSANASLRIQAWLYPQRLVLNIHLPERVTGRARITAELLGARTLLRKLIRTVRVRDAATIALTLTLPSSASSQSKKLRVTAAYLGSPHMRSTAITLAPASLTDASVSVNTVKTAAGHALRSSQGAVSRRLH